MLLAQCAECDKAPLWFVACPDAVPPFHICVHIRDSVGAVRQQVAKAYGCGRAAARRTVPGAAHRQPTVCTELLFHIGNQSISNVSALGLLVAQAVGSMQLIGIMHSFDSDEHVTYGEDVVQVHVWLLSGACTCP